MCLHHRPPKKTLFPKNFNPSAPNVLFGSVFKTTRCFNPQPKNHDCRSEVCEQVRHLDRLNFGLSVWSVFVMFWLRFGLRRFFMIDEQNHILCKYRKISSVMLTIEYNKYKNIINIIYNDNSINNSNNRSNGTNSKNNSKTKNNLNS